MGLFYLSVCLQAILFLYFELITLVDLYPWNDLTKYTRKEKATEAIVNGFVIIISLSLFLSKIKLLMLIAVVIYFVFFIMQMFVWWLPYITGIHLKQFPKEIYETHFQETFKFLPAIKNNIVPDAQHNVLQALSLATVIVSATSIFYL